MKTLEILRNGCVLSADSMLLNLSGVDAPSIEGVIVSSFEEASALQSAYTDFFGLGSSQYFGGLVSDTHYISYNGRIWHGNASEWQKAKEVLVDRELVSSLYIAFYDLLSSALVEHI